MPRCHLPRLLYVGPRLLLPKLDTFDTELTFSSLRKALLTTMQWFDSLPEQQNIFCCLLGNNLLIAHPNTLLENRRDIINTFFAMMINDEGLYLSTNSSIENIKATLLASKIIIEVERGTAEGLQCRYFIPSVEQLQVLPNARSSWPVVAPMEDVYLEVHVKDVFGEKNPMLWKGNDAYQFFGCRLHQPRVAISVKRVQVFPNERYGIELEGELREVTRKWFKAGWQKNWGT